MLDVILLEGGSRRSRARRASVAEGAPGFARNFLLPRQVADVGDKENLTYFE